MQARAVPVRIIAWQVVTGCVGALMWLVESPAAAYAALAGGLGSALLSLQFAVRVFGRKNAQSPESIVAAFYRAEVFKLFGAMLMFGLVAKYFKTGFIPFATTFVATLGVYFAALRWRIAEDSPASHSAD
ncbi:MAG: ATP synthase subunit I [Pseudomonadota bacterium]